MFDQLRSSLTNTSKRPELASNVFVVGLGRFGVSLASTLVELDIEVLAIDTNQKLVDQWADKLTHVRRADGTSADTLRQLGAAQFDAAVVAIGTGVEASILTTAALIDVGVTTIWAKAITPEHARILTRVGANHVVQPEYEMGKRVAHQVTGEVIDYVTIDDGFVLAEIQAPEAFNGQLIKDLHVRDQYNVNIVSIKHAGARFTHASPDTVVTTGDIILVAGEVADVERFAHNASR